LLLKAVNNSFSFAKGKTFNLPFLNYHACMSNSLVQPPLRIIKYNPQLDGLRFCAVFVVVCYHWIPYIFLNQLTLFFGGFVNFFFVLSSYLITKILLSAKEKSYNYNIPRYKVILFFLFRRTIRIFPAYYVFLLVVLLIPVVGEDVKNHATMYFTYLANYHIFNATGWPLVTSHVWTLAVEEQFYIFWPLIIIFVPHRYLLKTFILLIITSVGLRAYFYQANTGFFPQSILTEYCIGSFAVGGILAYMYTIPEKREVLITKYLKVMLLIGIPVGITIIIMKSFYLSFVLNGLIISLISLFLIRKAIFGYKGFMGKFLENRIVLYLGKISYGIYLYHLLVPVIFWRIFDNWYAYFSNRNSHFFSHHNAKIVFIIKILSSQIGCFIIYSIFTVAIAMISWNVIEEPFNRLKGLFNPGIKGQTKTSETPS